MTLITGPRNFKVGFWLGSASLHHGGLAPYTWRVLNALLTNPEPEWQFALLCHEQAQVDANRITDDLHSTSATVHVIPPETGDTSLWQQQVRRSSLGGKPASEELSATQWHYLTGWLNGLKLDLLHFPMPTPPFPAGHVPYLVPPLSSLIVPYIVTVHDLQELHFPEYFSAAQRAIRAMHHWRALDQARKIIVSYNHIKQDLLRYFRLPADRVHVCPIPHRSIHLAEPTLETAARYEQKYGAWQPYLLYPAQTWPHKNHLQLIHALQTLRQQGDTNLRLICTGGQGEFHGELVGELERLTLTESVLFAGIVPEDELSWLYHHTTLVVVPTLYEAGSFPLLEAMLHNVPVICSNVTSLPETIGDNRFVFSPYNVEELASLIQRMMTDTDFREANISNSRKRAEELRQVNVAPYFYRAYRSVVEEG